MIWFWSVWAWNFGQAWDQKTAAFGLTPEQEDAGEASVRQRSPIAWIPPFEIRSVIRSLHLITHDVHACSMKDEIPSAVASTVDIYIYIHLFPHAVVLHVWFVLYREC